MTHLTARQKVLYAYLRALVDGIPFSTMPAFDCATVFNDPELAAFADLRLF